MKKSKVMWAIGAGLGLLGAGAFAFAKLNSKETVGAVISTDGLDKIVETVEDNVVDIEDRVKNS